MKRPTQDQAELWAIALGCLLVIAVCIVVAFTGGDITFTWDSK